MIRMNGSSVVDSSCLNFRLVVFRLQDVRVSVDDVEQRTRQFIQSIL